MVSKYGELKEKLNELTDPGPGTTGERMQKKDQIVKGLRLLDRSIKDLECFVETLATGKDHPLEQPGDQPELSLFEVLESTPHGLDGFIERIHTVRMRLVEILV